MSKERHPSLRSAKVRLDKILAHLGLGSRKEIYRLARAGLITVDGEVITDSGFKLDSRSARIVVDGEEVFYREFFHVLLHKPAGYVTSTKDRDGPPVTDLLEMVRDDWMPVGRLDKDTEGLLLITTDGELAHRLTHPRWKVPKRYYAELAEPATQADVEAFAAGFELEGEPLQPAELRLEADGRRVELVIREGKYHQVKRMFAARGNHVTYLRRVAFGPLELPEDLEPGESRYLTAEEEHALYGAVGLEPGV
ncbi:MAG TPA: pseudouridine synthase [Meiothermus sp.]|jgi:16S rRNA pseudouridine516 synthase|nr:pseudouridine synthase [Meiothermus sp.]